MAKKYKILMVDDSVDWLKSHKNTLVSDFGEDFFDMDFATSGKDGFNKVLQKKSYDLVLVDLEMESIYDEPYAGSWMVKNLLSREEAKNTKFIIISGAYNIRDIAEILKVSHIAKSSLVSNPLMLKYKIMDILNLEIA